MVNLSFENRVSLIRKSEDLTKAVEELSSSYEKREDFVSKNPYRTQTSEICLEPFVCAVVLAVAIWVLGAVIACAAVGAGTVALCAHEALPCNDYAMIDSVIYKNIV
jgi:hypothetical protein